MAVCSTRQFCQFLKLAGFVVCCAFAWYCGQMASQFLCQRYEEQLVSTAVENFYGVNKREAKPGQVPVPKTQKCNRWSACPSGKFAFQILSGGGMQHRPKICLEDETIIDASNAGRGINIAVVDASSGSERTSASFDMWAGDNSGALIQFIHKVPNGSFVLMATFDEGSTKLKPEARKVIENLGSTVIAKIGFRSSWVFLGAKGFDITDNIDKEKILYSDRKTNRYQGWPAEIQIDGCVGHI